LAHLRAEAGFFDVLAKSQVPSAITINDREKIFTEAKENSFEATPQQNKTYDRFI
jgi:hypothetical protein